MKNLLPRNNRPRVGLWLALLLAAWLGLAQTVAAAHDAIHFAHPDTELCDLLSLNGNGHGLVSGPAIATPPAPLPAPGCLRPILFSTAQLYPPFHSRAPPATA